MQNFILFFLRWHNEKFLNIPLNMFIISTFKNDNKNSISLLSIESNKSQISVKQCITITVQNIIVNIFHKQ